MSTPGVTAHVGQLTGPLHLTAGGQEGSSGERPAREPWEVGRHTVEHLPVGALGVW